jgi:DNA transformation protein and related proteins
MNREVCDYLTDMLAPWATVSARKMFGGFGLYRSGLMFGIVDGDTPYFKADETSRADYEAAGSAPFTYEARGKLVTLSYWQVPAGALDDEACLHEWAEKAYGAAVRAAAGKKTAKPSGLRSLGPKSAAWLKEAGIKTEADLRALGAAEAYRRLKVRNPKGVSLNMLWGLHAVLEGISLKIIDSETKARLKREAGMRTRGASGK